MPLEFLDSFDHYTTAEINQKWTSNQFASIETGGRNGGQCVQLNPGFIEPSGITKVFPTPFPSWTIGFAFNAQNIADSISAGFTIYESTDGGAQLSWIADGRVALLAGSNVVCVSQSAVPQNAWTYIEVNLQYSALSGNNWLAGSIAINGVTEATGGPANTGQPGLGSAATHAWGSGLGTNAVLLDDLYIANDNTFRGDVKVLAYFPYSNASGNLWSGTFADVNSNPPNDALDISDSTQNDWSMFGCGPIPAFTGTIPGLQVVLRAAGGAGTFVNVIGSAGPGTPGVQTFSPNAAYNFFCTPWDLDEGGAPWTVSHFNAIFFGIENTTAGGGVTLTCSQIVCEVMQLPTTANARFSQGVLEYAKLPTSANGRFSQGVIEYAKLPTSANGRFSQGVIEWPSQSQGGIFPEYIKSRNKPGH